MGLLRRSDAAELDGLSHQVRLERLADRLSEHGPITVRDTVVWRGGTRLALDLDDGAVLRLRLFWARHGAVIAVESVRFDDEIGWVLVVRTADGERRVDYAWLAELSPARS